MSGKEEREGEEGSFTEEYLCLNWGLAKEDAAKLLRTVRGERSDSEVDEDDVSEAVAGTGSVYEDEEEEEDERVFTPDSSSEEGEEGESGLDEDSESNESSSSEVAEASLTDRKGKGKAIDPTPASPWTPATSAFSFSEIDQAGSSMQDLDTLDTQSQEEAEDIDAATQRQAAAEILALYEQAEARSPVSPSSIPTPVPPSDTPTSDSPPTPSGSTPTPPPPSRSSPTPPHPSPSPSWTHKFSTHDPDGTRFAAFREKLRAQRSRQLQISTPGPGTSPPASPTTSNSSNSALPNPPTPVESAPTPTSTTSADPVQRFRIRSVQNITPKGLRLRVEKPTTVEVSWEPGTGRRDRIVLTREEQERALEGGRVQRREAGDGKDEEEEVRKDEKEEKKTVAERLEQQKRDYDEFHEEIFACCGINPPEGFFDREKSGGDQKPEKSGKDESPGDDTDRKDEDSEKNEKIEDMKKDTMEPSSSGEAGLEAVRPVQDKQKRNSIPQTPEFQEAYKQMWDEAETTNSKKPPVPSPKTTTTKVDTDISISEKSGLKSPSLLPQHHVPPSKKKILVRQAPTNNASFTVTDTQFSFLLVLLISLLIYPWYSYHSLLHHTPTPLTPTPTATVTITATATKSTLSHPTATGLVLHSDPCSSLIADYVSTLHHDRTPENRTLIQLDTSYCLSLANVPSWYEADDFRMEKLDDKGAFENPGMEGWSASVLNRIKKAEVRKGDYYMPVAREVPEAGSSASTVTVTVTADPVTVTDIIRDTITVEVITSYTVTTTTTTSTSTSTTTIALPPTSPSPQPNPEPEQRKMEPKVQITEQLVNRPDIIIPLLEEQMVREDGRCCWFTEKGRGQVGGWIGEVKVLQLGEGCACESGCDGAEIECGECGKREEEKREEMKKEEMKKEEMKKEEMKKEEMKKQEEKRQEEKKKNEEEKRKEEEEKKDVENKKEEEQEDQTLEDRLFKKLEEHHRKWVLQQIPKHYPASPPPEPETPKPSAQDQKESTYRLPSSLLTSRIDILHPPSRWSHPGTYLKSRYALLKSAIAAESTKRSLRQNQSTLRKKWNEATQLLQRKKEEMERKLRAEKVEAERNLRSKRVEEELMDMMRKTHEKKVRAKKQAEAEAAEKMKRKRREVEDALEMVIREAAAQARDREFDEAWAGLELEEDCGAYSCE